MAHEALFIAWSACPKSHNKPHRIHPSPITSHRPAAIIIRFILKSSKSNNFDFRTLGRFLLVLQISQGLIIKPRYSCFLAGAEKSITKKKSPKHPFYPTYLLYHATSYIVKSKNQQNRGAFKSPHFKHFLALFCAHFFLCPLYNLVYMQV